MHSFDVLKGGKIVTETIIVPQKTPVLKKAWRITKRVLLYALLGIVLLAVSGVAFVYFFEERIKQYALNRLNEELLAPVSFDKMEFSILSRFPSASLEFTNVRCAGVGSQAGDKPMLEAGSIFFEFNIWDLLRGDYIVKKITLKNGSARMLLMEDGSKNFKIWKDRPAGNDQPKKKSIRFNLKTVSIDNFLFELHNRRSLFHIISDIGELRMKGKFSEKNFTLSAKGNVFMSLLEISGFTYLEEKNVKLNTKLDVNLEASTYDIRSAELAIEQMLLEGSGTIRADSLVFADLALKGKNMDVGSFLSLIPKAANAVKDYESSGTFYLEGKIKGYLGKANFPFMYADFGVENGKVKHKKTGKELTGLNFKGNFSSGDIPSVENASLSLQDISGNIGASTISGWLTVRNFKQPEVHFHTKSHADLEELSQFVEIPGITSMKGTADADIEFKGKSYTGQFTREELKESDLFGHVTLKEGFVKLAFNPLPFENLTGKIVFDKTDATVESFSCKAGSTSFTLSGKLQNLVPYIYLPNTSLGITGKVKADKVLLDEWLTKGSTVAEGISGKIVLPAFLTCNLDMEVTQFNFRKFEGKNISGKLSLKNAVLVAENLSLDAFAGHILLSGYMNGNAQDKLKVGCNSTMTKVDITKVFYQLENFGQQTLKDEHIKGQVDAVVEFSADFTPELSLLPGTVVASADIVVHNGELNSFKPLKSLSKFIQVEELEHVKFATLTNKILIRDKQVIIPEMDVKSTALNLVISGVHGFDNTIEYHFNLLLRDILAQKFKTKNKNKQSEFGDIIEDEEKGMRVFLKMTGTVDNPVISYDRKKVSEKIKEDFKEEGQTIKEIFKEEFGLFQKDTTIKVENPLPKKPNDNKVEASEFEFEF